MPFRSTAQRSYMHIHHPEIAKRWDKLTPKGAKLPMHVHKKGSKSGLEMLNDIASPKIPKKYKGYKVKVDNKMKSFGETDDEKKEVKINKKKSLKAGGKKELIDTLYHEKYHVQHPKALEKTTYKKTAKYISKIKKHAKEIRHHKN